VPDRSASECPDVKITNDCLTRCGKGCFVAVPNMATNSERKRVNQTDTQTHAQNLRDLNVRGSYFVMPFYYRYHTLYYSNCILVVNWKKTACMMCKGEN